MENNKTNIKKIKKTKSASQHNHSIPHAQQVFSAPPDIDKTIHDLFKDVVESTTFAPHLSTCETLFKLAKKSIKNNDEISKITPILKSIPNPQFGNFIHLLHIGVFIQTLKTNASLKSHSNYLPIPVTQAVQQLLACTDIATALDLLPMHLVDVFTAHPVDMDRGLILNHKRQLELLTRTWESKKEAYPLIQDSNTKLSARAELGDLSQSIRNVIYLLIHTPNYRKTKVKADSEQRNLSRVIKANENSIVTHWPKLILVIQFIFLEAIMEELCEKRPNLKPSLKPYIDLHRTPENLRRLSKLDCIHNHPCFEAVISLPSNINYSLQIWRGDMDGNPFVTGQTIALSMAYGRKRCFERLSADDAVIRYNAQNSTFTQIEDAMKTRLTITKKEGKPAWITYIKSREKAAWEPVQIYSGLMYYRMVEMTEAAETYSRKKKNEALLLEGFKNEDEFLHHTELLQQAEEASGIRNGTWAKCRQLVTLRGLSLGLPHAREGESAHVTLVQELLSTSFDQKTPPEIKELLHGFLSQKPPNRSQIKQRLSGRSMQLLGHYGSLIKIQPTACLVQSDSGSVLQDIELSILILKAVSHVLEHQGSLTILCEDKKSMLSAIAVMKTSSKNPELFNRIVMMCAGSDNQKKTGPFYSSYINTLFLKTAHKYNIPAFFGVGDSPLRSSTLDPQCELKTFQPGSQKKYFFGDSVFLYLSNRLANQINHLSFNIRQTPEIEEINDTVLKCLGETMFKAYAQSIKKRTQLHTVIQSISEIVTTYFSRPSKKYGNSGAILDVIRAIDSGRTQLILNTFDPQLSGLMDGLSDFQNDLKTKGISKQNMQDFFNDTLVGQSILETLRYFADHLDDDLPDPQILRDVSTKDIATVYKAFCGKSMKMSIDPFLRLSRLVWSVACESSDKEHHQAVAMMMFGANWMI